MADDDRAPARRDRVRSPRMAQGYQRERLTVYISADERALLEAKAETLGVSMSRILVDGALHSGRSEFVDGATLSGALSTLTDLQQQIRGIAGNLNQLAHHANATQEFPVDAVQTAKRVKALVLRVEDVLASVTR